MLENLSGPTQNIKGSNHHIAGRDINYIPRTEPTEPEDHPLITFCPQCKRKEWRLSERCWYCEGNVRQMWDDLEHNQALRAQREHRAKVEFKGYIAMFIGIAISIAGAKWPLPLSIHIFGIVLAIIGGMFAGVITQR